jgi:hypothetical protein
LVTRRRSGNPNIPDAGSRVNRLDAGNNNYSAVKSAKDKKEKILLPLLCFLWTILRPQKRLRVQKKTSADKSGEWVTI